MGHEFTEIDLNHIHEEVWVPNPEDDEIPPQDRNPDLCQICGKVVELPVCASHYDAVQADLRKAYWPHEP